MRSFLLPILLLAACTPIEERYAEAFVQQWVGTEAIGEVRVALPDVTNDPEAGITTVFNVYLDARLSGAVVLTLDYDVEPEDEFQDFALNVTGDWNQLSTRPEAFDLDIEDTDGEELDGTCVMAETFATLSCEIDSTVYEFAEQSS